MGKLGAVLYVGGAGKFNWWKFINPVNSKRRAFKHEFSKKAHKGPRIETENGVTIQGGTDFCFIQMAIIDNNITNEAARA